MAWIPNPRKINYPVSLGVYQTNKHLVFVFGDVHYTYKSKLCLDCDNTQKCMTMDFWIRELVEKAPVCVDVFIEDSLSLVVAKHHKLSKRDNDLMELLRKHTDGKKQIPDQSDRGGLLYMQKSFLHCFGRKCHPNARFHTTDVRQSFTGHDNKVNEKIGAKYRQLTNVEDARKEYKKDVRSIVHGKYKHTHFMKLAKQLKILKKQNKIKWTQVMSILDELPKFLSSQEKWKKYQISFDIAENAPILFYKLIDVYMFARMMKKSIDSKIVVIYAGDEHAKTDCDFLEKVLGAECLLRKQLDQKNWKQCLEIMKEEWAEIQSRSIY